MYEAILIGLISLLAWGVHKRAYQHGFQVGMHIGFTNGLWKCKERNAIGASKEKKKESDLSWVD